MEKVPEPELAKWKEAKAKGRPLTRGRSRSSATTRGGAVSCEKARPSTSGRRRPAPVRPSGVR
eukprot:4532791-Lingulodinium_polyedra.AAC.1